MYFIKQTVIGLILVFTLIITGCKKHDNHDVTKTIVATINPYYLITKELAGDRFKVDLLIPVNSSPHTFSPKPSDMKKLEDATLVIANGLHLEEQFYDKLNSMKKQVFYAEKAIDKKFLLKNEIEENANHHEKYGKHSHHKGGHDDHHHGNFDNHLWMGVQNIKVISRKITDELIKIDKPSTEYFENNLRKFNMDLTIIDKIIRSESSKLSERGLVTFHNSFGYFIREYKLKLVGVVENSPGKNISPAYLASIGKKINKNKLKVIYIEPQLNPEPAKVIASEFGLKIDVLDHLGVQSEVKKFADIYRVNWEKIRKYLK